MSWNLEVFSLTNSPVRWRCETFSSGAISGLSQVCFHYCDNEILFAAYFGNQWSLRTYVLFTAIAQKALWHNWRALAPDKSLQCYWEKYIRRHRTSAMAGCLKTLAKRTRKSRRKSTQACKTRTCVRTCEGWPNGFARRLASRKKP